MPPRGESHSGLNGIDKIFSSVSMPLVLNHADEKPIIIHIKSNLHWQAPMIAMRKVGLEDLVGVDTTSHDTGPARLTCGCFSRADKA